MRESGSLKTWRAWACLLLVIIAEWLIVTRPQLGLILHALLLIGMLIYGVGGQPGPERSLILSLVLAPLVRLLSLSLPLAAFPRLLWYPLVMLPLMNAARIAARTLGLSREELGLRAGNWLLQIAVAPAGLGIGVVEYLILRPKLLVPSGAWGSYVLTALILMVFVGFGEELVFRGLLQSLAQSAMGRMGIVYVSLLFAALHIGYRSLADVLLAFVLGILFALFVRKSRSILGVSLAHGLANVTLFLVMPQLAHQPFFQVVAAAMVGGSAVAVAIVVWVTSRLGRMDSVRGHERGVQTPLAPPALDHPPQGGSWSEAADLRFDEHTDKRKDKR